VTITLESTTTAKLSSIEIELHPKKCNLKSNYTQSDMSDNSSATNFIGNDTQETTSTIMSESTATAELSGIEPNPKRRKVISSLPR